MSCKHTFLECGTRRGRGVLASLCGLALALCALLLLRLHLMGMRPPGFAKADNPTARCPSLLTRTLTFAYLPAFNLGLLLWPRWLSFDWSMDAIPRVTSLFDPRSAITLVFYYLLYRVTKSSLKKLYAPLQTEQKIVPYRKQHRHSRRSQNRTKQSITDLVESSKPTSTPCPVCKHSLLDHSAVCRNNNNNNTIPMLGTTVPCCCTVAPADIKSAPKQRRLVSRINFSSAQVLLISLAFLAVPFIPASNLFFYVGFVVAERVLYIPSVGYCLIIGLGCQVLRSKTNRNFVLVCVTLLLVAFSARTMQRNLDWLDEENLFRAGVPINPPKAYGNLGSVLSSRGKTEEAEWAFRMALKFRSNMADVHYNLGNLLQSREQYDEAIHSYELAIQYRPTLAVAHLNLGRLLESRGRCQEAMAVYRRCSQLDGTGLKDPRTHEATKLSALLHLGRLYAEQGLHQEAIAVYHEALESTPEFYPLQPGYSQLDEVRARLQQYRTRRVAVTSQSHNAVSTTHAQRHESPKNRSRGSEAEPWLLARKQVAPPVYQHFGVAESSAQDQHAAADHQAERGDAAPT
ncbi:protein O-mannosyl-transferase Tmtc2 [Anabrus simplex]|uniref:protein O-mannosyl-transferase Tmtc2 n=1 Tax=Anabrus simplex TaxID=316456 RepID=UPI0035A32F59